MSSTDPGRARGAPPMHRPASAAAKLTGQLPYVLDMTPSGALYGRLIRARRPHSIVTIDRMALLAKTLEQNRGYPTAELPAAAIHPPRLLVTAEK